MNVSVLLSLRVKAFYGPDPQNTADKPAFPFRFLLFRLALCLRVGVFFGPTLAQLIPGAKRKAGVEAAHVVNRKGTWVAGAEEGS